MTVDYEAWRFWLGILQFLGTVIIGVYVWWSNREKVTSSRFQSLEKEVAKRATSNDLDKVKETVRKHQEERCNLHLTRTAALEVAHKASPTHEDLGKVYELINKVGGAVESLKGTMGGINNNVNLLVEHHLRGGKS